jgi:mono/diheme cytochrome c family protein
VRRWSRASFFILACVGAVVSIANGQTASMSSVLAGAFSEEQAIRGQALYYEHCLECHGEMLNGLDQAPPLAGPQFTDVWDGEPLAALVARIDTMPPIDPGSLARSDNVDILAYMLWYNGLPIGDLPLSAEQSVLTQMLFQTPPLPGQ